VFVSAAAHTGEDEYTMRVRQAMRPLDVEVEHLHTEKAPLPVLERAAAIFVGGGNTWRLLHRLHAAGLVEPLRARVRAGLPYLGASAGANIAGPNILTTNDWNVDASTTFTALGFVPFNLNPHYVETDPTTAPFAETRDERIGQYLLLHTNPVVGLEEQTWIECTGEAAGALRCVVGGSGRARVFRRGRLPRDHRAGEVLEW
jgi:dipeptidase E